MIKKIFASFLFFSLVFLGTVDYAMAQTTNYFDEFAKKTTLSSSADPKTELIMRVGTVINVLLGLMGIAFTFLTIYGGYLWMLARGNDQQVEKAKNLITAAIIGLIIVLAAYAITYILIDKIGSGVLVEDVLEG